MEGLFDEVTFEQRQERSEGNHEVSGRRVFYSVASKALRSVPLVCPWVSVWLNQRVQERGMEMKSER